MKKRYQVFISSTYTDLVNERKEITESIMQLDCIPAGMELFGAVDDEQFEFIKTIINDCDYYILIIGGRYGSEDFTGVSYTEKEFEYAVSKGIPVLAFIHGEPDNIPYGKSEKNPDKLKKLEEFKKKVMNQRLIMYWTNPSDLISKVIISLTKAQKTHPQIGWIRGNQSNNETLLEQLNVLRLENTSLKEQMVNLSVGHNSDLKNLAQGDEVYNLFGNYKFQIEHDLDKWEIDMTWDEIFTIVGPRLYEFISSSDLARYLTLEIENRLGIEYCHEFSIDNGVFNSIKMQYKALGLIDIERSPSMPEYEREQIVLTEFGEEYLMNIMTIKSKK